VTNIDDAVRAWANGIYPTEAGAELLIRHGKAIYEGAPWLTELDPLDDSRPRMASIDTETLLEETGAWSGGERRIVRIAASLLGGPPADLANDIPGLDRTTMALVLAALAHANGSHEHSAVEFDERGIPVRVGGMAGSLYPWPERPERLRSV
jgi:hypothetical protein